MWKKSSTLICATLWKENIKNRTVFIKKLLNSLFKILNTKTFMTGKSFAQKRTAITNKTLIWTKKPKIMSSLSSSSRTNIAWGITTWPTKTTPQLMKPNKIEPRRTLSKNSVLRVSLTNSPNNLSWIVKIILKIKLRWSLKGKTTQKRTILRRKTLSAASFHLKQTPKHNLLFKNPILLRISTKSPKLLISKLTFSLAFPCTPHKSMIPSIITSKMPFLRSRMTTNSKKP